MFVNINDSEFINVDTISTASVEQGVLRIVFINGSQVAYFDKDRITKVISKLKKKANESV